jgi:Protein of unknown function (DUF3300)
MRYLKIVSTGILMSLLFVGLTSVSAFAQEPRYYPPQELEHLVSRVALYPDPLLAQVLAAASFPDQIPDAARWADRHRNATGDALSRAISEDNLPWDPSVQALLPFPSVLGMMASDMPWTENLGNAFLAQNSDVMDAVQRMRHHAYDYGYLRTNPQIVVTGGPYIEIRPVRPEFLVVPAYDPAVVFVRPRFGFAVGGAIHFGYGVTVGAAFRPWGWGMNRIAWDRHAIFINNARWDRNWHNRAVYVHPYEIRHGVPPRVEERHEIHEQVVRERVDDRPGRARVEEHRAEEHHVEEHRADEHRIDEHKKVEEHKDKREDNYK